MRTASQFDKLELAAAQRGQIGHGGSLGLGVYVENLAGVPVIWKLRLGASRWRWWCTADAQSMALGDWS